MVIANLESMLTDVNAVKLVFPFIVACSWMVVTSCLRIGSGRIASKTTGVTDLVSSSSSLFLNNKVTNALAKAQPKLHIEPRTPDARPISCGSHTRVTPVMAMATM